LRSFGGLNRRRRGAGGNRLPDSRLLARRRLRWRFRYGRSCRLRHSGDSFHRSRRLTAAPDQQTGCDHQQRHGDSRDPMAAFARPALVERECGRRSFHTRRRCHARRRCLG
jgi:hypothetical protein